MLHRIKRKRLIPTVNEMMAANKCSSYSQYSAKLTDLREAACSFPSLCIEDYRIYTLIRVPSIFHIRFV